MISFLLSNPDYDADFKKFMKEVMFPSSMKEKVRTSAPGRICLFGEHQDYLGLPIIASAISMRFHFEGEQTSAEEVQIFLEDTNQVVKFHLGDVGYTSARDYFKATINVLRRRGFEISRGITARGWSEIPIQAGVSSSSAMINAWMAMVLKINGYPIPSPLQLGRMVYEAEVEEFGEPGGKMDQFTIAIGHQIYLETHPIERVSILPAIPGNFLLIDSGQEKDTIPVLAFAKEQRIRLLHRIQEAYVDYTWANIPKGQSFFFLSADENKLVQATIRNRLLLNEALAVWNAPIFNTALFGRLLTEHHEVLSRDLKVSTALIDQSITDCINLGALGGKIVGSGGGGCFLLYSLGGFAEVTPYLDRKGLRYYRVKMDEGTRIDS